MEPAVYRLPPCTANEADGGNILLVSAALLQPDGLRLLDADKAAKPITLAAADEQSETHDATPQADGVPQAEEEKDATPISAALTNPGPSSRRTAMQTPVDTVTLQSPSDSLPAPPASPETVATPSAISEPLSLPMPMLPRMADMPVYPNMLPGPGVNPDFSYHYGGKARAYYLNNQRVEFTGMEATFAVQGEIDAGVRQTWRGWDLMVESQIFLNQPYDTNKLEDSQFLRSFAADFNVEPLVISQLYFAAKKDYWYLTAGKFVTPFGRFYFPLFLNDFSDSPYIRSEAIQFRETGLMAQYCPPGYSFTAAITNGGQGQDTNSSKAFIGRVGAEGSWYAYGVSVKGQDGIGSQGTGGPGNQKESNSHIGGDAMITRGNWTLSSETIYDFYGFNAPGFNPNDIFWGRSIYFRDLSRGEDKPLTGVGYYVNLGYQGPRWMLMLNYGDYYALQKLGIPAHDVPVHRGLMKASYHFTRRLEAYGVVLVENSVPLPVDNLVRKGFEVIAGWQFTL